VLRLSDGLQRILDFGGAEISRFEHIFFCAPAGVGDIFVPYTPVLHEAGLSAME
jgi:hypothetical protein